MRRTTTAQHRLTFPMTLTPADALTITYAQGGVVVIKKDLENVEVDDKVVTVNLSQSETAFFLADEPVEIQAKFRIDGSVFASNIQRIPARRILDDETFGEE